ncbi:MAG TPA: glycoside hydrolase family 2 TIM barrel-domain containing protein, partial [Ilumatobacteraceae bacterium]|nr:glycoside hydrolase family 2 TIM barrel-domain containing protein [Ilumatobacteraceae bacterium]
MLPVIGPIRAWEDPTLLHLNRLPMHVPLRAAKRRVLDGTWTLELFDGPGSVPETAITGSHRHAVEVEVPGNWTMQDLGAFVDLPHYTNIQMPFAGPPPRLPERNATGVYRRTFDVPATWTRTSTVLHIGGAEGVHAVYVNGEFAGYGTDSRLPSEYDVSTFVRAGRNELAVVVIRFSAHSYIEDQDQWWMAGLHRSVWIESRPRVRIADVRVATDLDVGSGTGSIRCTTVVDFGGRPVPGWSIRTSVADPRERAVGRTVVGPVPHRFTEPYAFRGHQVDSEFTVARALAWSAETPSRYSVNVELLDPKGVVRHAETQLVGITKVEVRDRHLMVNGRPIWIFGVNRHDDHPDRGKAVTVDDMRADLLAMRDHNITAIRTSHYPNDEAFLDLCDELGFYVVAEANVESHAYNFLLCDEPTYRSAWLDRGARLVERDRNHPSVILWSLGNESGYGSNHDALAGWIRAVDPTRPLHYEDAVRIKGWVDGGRHATDVTCPMYPEIEAIAAYGREGAGDRPLIMCEYSHAMGNSNGSLADYWDAITGTPGLQGGFIWEWKDHGLRQRLGDGSTRLAYGGQFGDTPNDGNFVADGLMSAELVPHPALREVAWVHRPVTVSLGDGALVVENRQSFRTLDWLTAHWELLIDGEVARHGRLRVPRVEPHSGRSVAVPCALPAGEHDLRLTVRWTTARDEWWAEAGWLVAWDQVTLRESRPRGMPPRADPPDAALVSEPRLNLWRAPTDNDGFKLMPELAQRLRVGGQALRHWQAARVDTLPADALVDHHVEVTDDAHGRSYRHQIEVPETLADLPRVGVIFSVEPRFARLRWFGRGPHENYPDRNRSAMVGIWEGEPEDCPYLVPQEHALRTECRWFELHDPSSGDVLRIESLG